MSNSGFLSNSDLIKILEAPSYSLAETARLTELSSSRVRRWLQGYSYSYSVADGQEIRHGSQEPVVERGRTSGTSYASFLDLIDLLFVKRFLDHGFGLPTVRRALDEAREHLGTDHFARRTFFTSGKSIFLQMDNRGKYIIKLMSGGQWAIADIIINLAKRIDFDEATDFARRWYPWGKNRPIVIDPLISFGRPSIIGRGTATESIYDLYRGENDQLEEVCRWMGLTMNEANAAVEFELQLAA